MVLGWLAHGSWDDLWGDGRRSHSRKALLFAILALGSPLAGAHSNSWATGIGASGTDRSPAVAVDTSGGAIVVGEFSGTVDFDRGPGVAELTSAGQSAIYVARYDASGSFDWVVQVDGGGLEEVSDVALDAMGNTTRVVDSPGARTSTPVPRRSP